MNSRTIRARLFAVAVCSSLASTSPAAGASPQNPAAASTADSVVPRLVRFDGTVTNAKGPVTLTFSMYEFEEGGTPLWSETQQAQPDEQGHYTVLLGATQPDGLPLDLFTSGKARWLGVQPELPGVAEQPRVLLVGMPYALKAADADTLGGLPPSAFAMAGSASSSAGGDAPTTASEVQGGSGAGPQSPPASTITGSGTANMLAMFTGSSTIGNSRITQRGGAAVVSEALQLPALGMANSTQGFSSQPNDSLASAYNSSTNSPITQHFRWQAEPVNNNTASPSGKFSLLFASGSGTTAETGFSFGGDGTLTFVSGQTFPGTGPGTVTSVGSGAGLTGGPITGSGTLSIASAGVTNAMLQNPSLTVSAGTDLTGGGTVSLGSSVSLSLDTAKVPQLNAANSFTGNQSVTGNVSATNQLISTVAPGTAPLAVSSTTQVANLNASFVGGLAASAFAQIALPNTFTGTQTISSGDLTVSRGNLSLTQTTASTVGVVNLGGSPFIHACCGASNHNTFLGGYAGNFSVGSGSSYNTAAGYGALTVLSTGSNDTAAGALALASNTTAPNNAALGYAALYANTTGVGNTAVGSYAGYTYASGNANTTGSNNTFIGYNSGPGVSREIDNATAIGANAMVSESNALVLGATGIDVGIGTSTPSYSLHVGSGNNYSFRVDGPAPGTINPVIASFGGSGDFGIDAVGFPEGRFVVKDGGKIGIGTAYPSNIFTIAQGAGRAIGDGWDTYSSRRWKTNVRPLQGALAKVERLRAVSYDLTTSGKHEIGVIAEEVGEVVPEVVSYESNGRDARGVDYSRLTALLIEATKEQQVLIRRQDERIKAQQAHLVAQQAEIAQLASEVRLIRASLRARRRAGSTLRLAEDRMAPTHAVPDPVNVSTSGQ